MYKTMKNIRVYFMTLLILLTFTLSSCEVVGDIFKAGMWTALIIIVIVVLIIVWIFRRFTGR
ncbi:hypothetical protein DXT99_26305 [Pontibacter diazotrophicus]|uniref:Phosphatidate cytidylyltransferase n=2 Tax=Pontibacter diazotrophicus TaxID=1400979 RepID=A0A3D8KYW6_9BACT|nr:hypothetical protein DXT99_26305 [Pontibacter diazotrophicus]